MDVNALDLVVVCVVETIHAVAELPRISILIRLRSDDLCVLMLEHLNDGGLMNDQEVDVIRASSTSIAARSG